LSDVSYCAEHTYLDRPNGAEGTVFLRSRLRSKKFVHTHTLAAYHVRDNTPSCSTMGQSHRVMRSCDCLSIARGCVVGTQSRAKEFLGLEGSWLEGSWRSSRSAANAKPRRPYHELHPSLNCTVLASHSRSSSFVSSLS